jgi:hypothetical protein
MGGENCRVFYLACLGSCVDRHYFMVFVSLVMGKDFHERGGALCGLHIISFSIIGYSSSCIVLFLLCKFPCRLTRYSVD